MWPWEHLAFGYVLFSLGCRLSRTVEPSDRSALLLVLFTQFPDLVDKPLAWVFGVLPSGLSLAHSVFVAVPVSIAALLLGRRRGQPAAGLAVAVGYPSHLLGDAVYPAITGGTIRVYSFLWPVVVVPSNQQAEVVAVLRSLLSNLAVVLTGEFGPMYLAAEVLLVSIAAGLWYLDGRPGIHRLGATIERKWWPS